MQELFKLDADSLVRNLAGLIENTQGARYQKTSSEPRLGPGSSQHRKPGILTKNRAEVRGREQ